MTQIPALRPSEKRVKKNDVLGEEKIRSSFLSVTLTGNDWAHFSR